MLCEEVMFVVVLIGEDSYLVGRGLMIGCVDDEVSVELKDVKVDMTIN